MNYKGITFICLLIAVQFLGYTQAQSQDADRSEWRCGNGNECPAGSCCSVWGWCGRSETHCTVECKSQCKNNVGGLSPSATSDMTQGEQKATFSSSSPTGSSQVSDSAKETDVSSMSSGMTTPASANTASPTGSLTGSPSGSPSAKATSLTNSGMKTTNAPTTTTPSVSGSTNKPGASTVSTSSAVSILTSPYEYQVLVISAILCALSSRYTM
ncbi:hypothetical protein K493DRAFT_337743 [Basidiobolus meristosporus CBS 931.73]|uniref:Chitin-binding type-1 domain-containing protein n=1 Tax=Basidiobolus meristosporus CBS 931.73 TaxID=1314790 RepID=A0A1Y1Y9L4_9FUNG|nr:hypothetical protein K493DRAFT_337743 [Basidiobolus meristosporus CBS 931.73]|eukprot:ORX94585.1 hypothetical protein K493DRAFT_337743 [Basidiobolus meristosporus CBS 931.73]